jgi:hypothetical protein
MERNAWAWWAWYWLAIGLSCYGPGWRRTRMSSSSRWTPNPRQVLRHRLTRRSCPLLVVVGWFLHLLVGFDGD